MADQPVVCVCATGIRMLTFADGSQFGVVNLDETLKEVADLKLIDPQSIRAELLKRFRVRNYVVRGAENEYTDILLKEYRRRYKEAESGR